MKFGKIFNGGEKSEEKPKTPSYNFIANPPSGEEKLADEKYETLDILDQIDGVIKQIKSGEGDEKFLRNKLSNFKEELKKEIKRLETDSKGKKGNSGLWDAELEKIKSLKTQTSLEKNF